MEKSYEELKEWVRGIDVQEIFNISKNQDISGTQRSIAYGVAKKLQYRELPSFKQLKALDGIYRDLKTISLGHKGSHSGDLASYANQNVLDIDTKHLCLRMAWHDNKWNGSICKKPADNDFCIGEYSLLSDRIRRRRNLEAECKQECNGCKADSPNLGDYQPPCFWSINAFGSEALSFKHDNPVAPNFPTIDENLPPYSLISWPFKLSFVKDQKEKKKYNGNYYPKEIFENRIKIFRHKVKCFESVVFTYCNYSNPVSGEDMKYLVTGCALLAEQGESQVFQVTTEQLAKKAEELAQPNFPSMNWALRYTLDFEGSGAQIPYHEYLESLTTSGAVTEDILQQIAVTIEEPELREGFTYVAKHIDDDQAIYLLTKMRRSLLKVREQSVIDTTESERQLENVELLIELTWNKRGYLPGIKNLLLAIPGVKENYEDNVGQLIRGVDLADRGTVNALLEALAGDDNALEQAFGPLLAEVREFMEEREINAEEVLRLASLNLTSHQFMRICNREGIRYGLSEICNNPYLLFEDYEPGNDLDDPLSGEKIDGKIDLFKIDIAFLPLAKYQQRIPEVHHLKPTDHRRLRAVVIDILQRRENSGDCFLDVEEIIQGAEAYSLFYKAETPYNVDRYLKEPNDASEKHFGDKLVIRRVDGRMYYYLKKLFDDEAFVRAYIAELVDRKDHALSAKALEEDIPESIRILRKKIGERFDESQFRMEHENLYRRVAHKSFFVITGLPGAGKSRELLKLVNFLSKKEETHVVLSLTGKAVLRLKNNEEGIGGVNAKTIDKFLNEQEDMRARVGTTGGRVIHNLIIDEASMVDLPKLAAALRSIEKKHLKRLILVGDPNQLPPIGFGKPFSDIVERMIEKPDLYGDHAVKLEVNCRAEMSDEFIGFSRIFSNESKFAEGYLAQTAHEGQICDGNVDIVFWRNREDLQERIGRKIEDLLVGKGYSREDLPGFLGIRDDDVKPSALDRFQVLSPYRNGYFGASGLNLYFQDEFRAGTPFTGKIGEKMFKVFDKVMHTQNEYKDDDLLVSNGSLGATVGGKRVFFVEHDEPLNVSTLRTSNALELAYAITVHKSQGSGFNHVFIVLPKKALLSYRELLYTALTRARNEVTILVQQGEDIPDAPGFLDKIRSRSAVVQRRTSLFRDAGERYAYMPDEDVVVKSRVEYIIYRKLVEARDKHGNFWFGYEDKYDVKGHSFDIHPDFRIEFADGRVIYWEHLGLVTSQSYMNDWDKRRKLYEAQSDFDKVLTTDELRGISDKKIETIIEKMVSNVLVSDDDSNRYSKMHFSLR